MATTQKLSRLPHKGFPSSNYEESRQLISLKRSRLNKARQIFRLKKHPEPRQLGKILRFPRKMPVTSEPLVQLRNFAVKVANEKDAKKFIKFRGRIFAREYQGHKLIGRKDYDRYDDNAEQLILINTQTSKIISGARVIISDTIEDYYTHQEYFLDGLMALEGKKVEISRVCVHPKYRTGTSIILLWRGILAYALKKEAEYIFGMPSIQTMSKTNCDNFFDYCKNQGYTGPELAIPRPEYLKFPTYDPGHLHRKPENLMTPLMSVYLKAGAKICSRGNVDHDLRCIDFMTLLQLSEMNQKYRKYTHPLD